MTQTAMWAGLALGSAPRLSTLALSDANFLASSGLSVIINDGTDHIVDARSILGFASYREPTFTAASDISSTVTSANASIDQIQIQ